MTRVQSVMDAQLMFQSRDVGTITIGLFGCHLVWPGKMPTCLPFLLGMHPIELKTHTRRRDDVAP